MGKSKGPLTSVRTNRVRLIRMSDHKPMGGRVEHFDREICRVALSVESFCKGGEQFLVEIHAHQTKMLFTGVSQGPGDRLLDISVGDDLRFLPASEPARILVDDVSAWMEWRGGQATGHVIDISREGLAVVIDDEIPQKTVVEMKITKGFQTLDVKGIVRYCRDVENGLGYCRVGLRLIHETRVDTAKWYRLFDQELEAA